MEASLIIGSAISDMTTRICFGIPHRVGACACELGKPREDETVEESTETTTDFSNIVGSKREAAHSVVGVTYLDKVQDDGKNDETTSLAVSISCWSNYKTPEDVDTEGDPQIIFKTKGDVDSGVEESFPSIKITLRPLKTDLNYSYTGNANYSGEGEIGFESQDPTADALFINYWQGGVINNLFYTPGFDEYFEPYTENPGYAENLNSFEAIMVEMTTNPVVYSKTTFFKDEDRPPEDQTPFEPLTGLELDPTFHPRLPSASEYELGRNESFDYRHRFPSNYFQKYGTLTMPVGFPLSYPTLTDDKGNPVLNYYSSAPGSWVWTKHQPNQNAPLPLNPLFEPDIEKNIFPVPYGVRVDEGVAPVIKGWYWDNDTAPGGYGFAGIFQSTAFKMTKEIRKRYPFSFVAKQTRTESIRVYDHSTNQVAYPLYTQSGFFMGYQSYPATYQADFANTESSFEAVAWWRMEVEAKLCGWNSKKTISTDPQTGLPKSTITGATIKGVIKLGIKRIFPSQSAYGLYSKQTENIFDGGKRFDGVTPSFVFRCATEAYFDEYFNYRYRVLEYDGGEIPWEVTLDEDNAKGSPIKFLDFKITSEAELPGQQPPAPGTVPDNSIVFIKDFIVTEVIIP